MPVKVAINGFGRIGRGFMRSAIEREADVDVVAVNDAADVATFAALLRRDSVYGRCPGRVVASEGTIAINGSEISALSEAEPARLPWGELNVDVVVKYTGRFRTRAAAAQHLDAGARKVIISAPDARDGWDPTRPDDDGARLHPGSEPARRTSLGPAQSAGGGDQPGANLDRRGEGRSGS